MLLILLHSKNIQFIAIFYKLAANEHELLPKTRKIRMNIPELSRFFLVLLDFPCLFLIIQQLLKMPVPFNDGEFTPSLLCYA